MSNSRFVLKQIPLRGAGASELTRYVAKSKLDPAREGKTPRELFTAHDESLTFWEARKWLSITGGALDKDDVLHYVLSFENAREYELLGENEDERRREIVAFLRDSIPVSLREIGIEEMRWVAGIHRNTDNPHIHILFNKNAIRRGDHELIRVPRLVAPVVAHHRTTPDGQREFSYGSLLDSFAAQVDMTHRTRARFIQFENSLRTVKFTRELLAPEVLQTRSPTEAERLIGNWLVAEIEAAHPPKKLKMSRVNDLPQSAKTPDDQKSEFDDHRRLIELRERVVLLESSARGQGNKPPHAFIEAETLRAILITLPHGLSVITHEQNPVITRTHYNDHIHQVPNQNHGAQSFVHSDFVHSKTHDQESPDNKEHAHSITPLIHTR